MRKDLYSDLYTTEETHWWHIAKREYVKWLIATHIRKKQLTILDVGCGTGRNMEELGKKNDVWGVDLSSEALAFCKKRGLVQVKKGKAENLPFPDDHFDVVCILDVLEHVDDISTVKEIWRVLKNEGRVLITVPAFSWLWSKWDEVLHHKRRYTKKQLTLLLEKEGFAVLRSTHIYSFLVIPSLIIRKLKQLSRKPYSSDFQMNNRIINASLSFLSRLEQLILNRYDMPFGTSVLCIAQKKQ